MNEEKITAALASILGVPAGDVFAVAPEFGTFKVAYGAEHAMYHYEAEPSGEPATVREVSYEEYCDLEGVEPDYGNGYHEWENYD